MLRRAAREHRRASTMDRRWITKPSAILSHRIYIADVYTSIADVSPMCLRCVWYIFNLGVHHRMFADCSALLGDISLMVFGVETSGENSNACIEIFLYVTMPWRSMVMTRVQRRLFDEPLVHGDDTLTMPKFEHRESIGRLKKSRGTVGLTIVSGSQGNRKNLHLSKKSGRNFVECKIQNGRHQSQ